MKHPVVIKSNRYGIVIILDEDISFEKLLTAVEEKFKDAGNFFKGTQIAVGFEGRKLSLEEEEQIVDVITANSDLDIACIIDQDSDREEIFKQTIEDKMTQVAKQTAEGTGQFYRGTLRSGQSIETENSIIILGDVNPGATVIASGNVVVLGSLKGTVYAGGNGDEHCFVVALDMDPIQIRIADVIARCSDDTVRNSRRYKKKRNSAVMHPQIAFVENDNIYIESITKDILKDVSD